MSILTRLAFWTFAFALLWSSMAPAQRVTNPREMLDIMQVDSSQRKHFADDRPIDDESETLGRILFRLPSFSQSDLDRWTKSIDDSSAMVRNPDSYRFELFDVRGDVESLRELEVIPEIVPRLGFRNYYEVKVRHDDTISTIYTRTIPRRWLSANERQPTDETVRVQALLLKRGVDEEGKQSLVFAAPRLNWHPSQPSDTFGTSNDQVLLGQLGLDIDRLTDLMQRAKMSGKDRECFYQALNAVRLAEPEQLAKLGNRDFDIARMIRQPKTLAGALHTIHGLARRAVLIRVDDKDIRERFGLDHYFEVEVFVPLERQVRFVDPSEPEDKEGKVFTDYPFVVCVPELPENMEQGDDIRVPVTFSGFFLKLWAYETEFMTGGRARTASPRLQQSPLFVGPTLTVGDQFKPLESRLSLYIACLFVGLLLFIWFLLWRSSISDKLASRRLFRKHEPGDGAFELLGDQ